MEFQMRSCLMAPVVVLALASVSLGATARVVHISNATGVPVDVTLTGWIDATGEHQATSAVVHLDAHASDGSMLVGGSPVIASEVELTYTTVDGSKSATYAAPEDDDDTFAIAIHSQDLARGAAPLTFANNTSVDVDITLLHYTTVDDQDHDVTRAPFTLAAGQNVTINTVADDGQQTPLAVSSATFLIETSDGASTWTTTFEGGDTVPTPIDDDLLAQQRQDIASAREKAIVKLVGAMLANMEENGALGKENPDLGDVLIAGASAYVRDQLIDSAVSDAFPAFSDEEHRAATIAIGLVFDGKLDAGDFASEEFKQHFIAQIGMQDADKGRIAQVCDFVINLIQREQEQQKANAEQHVNDAVNQMMAQ
jgi:hypothetical protein